MTTSDQCISEYLEKTSKEGISLKTEFETSMVGHIISVETCGRISKPTKFKF